MERLKILEVPVRYGAIPTRGIGMGVDDGGMDEILWSKNKGYPEGFWLDGNLVEADCRRFNLDVGDWGRNIKDYWGSMILEVLAKDFSARAYNTSLEASRVEAVLSGRREVCSLEKEIPVSELYYLSGSFFTFLLQRGEGKCLDFYEQVLEEREGDEGGRGESDQYEVVNMKKLWGGAKELGMHDAEEYIESIKEKGIKPTVYQISVPEFGVDISVIRVGNFTNENEEGCWQMMVETVRSWVQVGLEMGEDISNKKLVIFEMYNLEDLPGQNYLVDRLLNVTESMAFAAEKCVVVMPYCSPILDNGVVSMVVDSEELIGTMRHEMTHMLDFYGEGADSVLAEGMAMALEYNGDFALAKETLRETNDYCQVVTESQLDGLYGLASGGLRRVVSRVFQCGEDEARDLIEDYLKEIN